MLRRLPPAALALCASFGAVAAGGEKVATFDDESCLAGMEIKGTVSVDPSRGRETDGGGSLKIEAGGSVFWKLRDTNGSGRVEMWVYEDGAAQAQPKKYGAGAMWGLMQEDGSVLVAGAIYAPYLSGNTTYAVTDLDPKKNERAWWKVQYLGLKRKPGWHRWVFEFDPDEGLRLLHNDVDVNAKRRMFNWNKTRLRGFSGIAILGDTTNAKQVVWVDDVKATLGPEAEAQPLWPPPPPSTLAPVAPLREQPSAPYAQWANGPGRDPSYFPIAVWLQAPKNAKRYREAGFNLYVGLWKGPTEAQLAELRAAGMPVICSQNEVGLKHLDDKLIVGWMHGDEPDNAQRFDRYWKNDAQRVAKGWPEYGQRKWRGYAPPIPPQSIVDDYQKIAAADPSRPVIMNLGQGVAWDAWHGRGVRTNHPEDYPKYVKGCDVVSFDIYPAVHSNDAVRGNLWYVARGVSRLRKWTGDEKVVWNCIECTRISNPNVKPTPHQVRAEVWMALIHGSRGLIYFVHQFKPKFIEHALLVDGEMLEAVTALNKQIDSLASVINSPTIPDAATVKSSSPNTPIHVAVKKHEGATYLFAVAMYHQDTTATFSLAGLEDAAKAEVIGEGRTVPIQNGQFSDSFKGYDVHLYRIRGPH